MKRLKIELHADYGKTYSINGQSGEENCVDARLSLKLQGDCSIVKKVEKAIQKALTGE